MIAIVWANTLVVKRIAYKRKSSGNDSCQFISKFKEYEYFLLFIVVIGSYGMFYHVPLVSSLSSSPTIPCSMLFLSMISH